ncbi:MAG: energy transducer TonB [Chitinophagaceae bacterium]
MSLNKIVLFAFLLLTEIGHSQTASQADTSNASTKVFEKVEIEASYPLGLEGWRAFLEKNLNPNTPIDNGAPVGKYTVYVQFVVNKNGDVSDVQPLTKFGYGMEREVVELLKKSGQWNPATQDGRHVNAYRKQPVTFVVEQDGFSITSQVQNVLFTGTNNELKVEVNKVKNGDLNLTISQGTITPTGNGKFIAKVTRPGKAIVTVYNKKNKEIASVYFEVRPKE